MQNCLYQGKRINAFAIEDEANYDYIKEIKLASAKQQLLCEDCNSPMIFRKCTEKTSHFAHWKGLSIECTYDEYSKNETEEHKLCKKVLYNYFKELYPEALVETEYKVIPNRRSDVFILFENGKKLVLDIHKKTLSVTKWESKHNDYKDAGLTDVWFIAGTPFSDKEKNMPFFQQMVINESIDQIAIFLNSVTKQITLMKKMVYKNQYKEYSDLFSKVYSLNDIVIQPDGHIDTDFYTEFTKAEDNFCYETSKRNQRPMSNNYFETIERIKQEMYPVTETYTKVVDNSESNIYEDSLKDKFRKYKEAHSIKPKIEVSYKNDTGENVVWTEGEYAYMKSNDGRLWRRKLDNTNFKYYPWELAE